MFLSPFYTHTRGYKLSLVVHTNGYGIYTGTHMSVGICIMKGEFDDDLQWPFQGEITVQLLDQMNGEYRDVATIKKRSLISSITGCRNYSKDPPYPDFDGHFIPHSQLNTRNFLQYNTLKFRVSKATKVDPIAQLNKRLGSLAVVCFVQACVIGFLLFVVIIINK